MRRDVCYFIPADLVGVYDAFATILRREGFITRDKCGFEPYHTITFALQSSFKYNMNGGACTIHFMPYKNGTAVDLRFSIVQLVGARYGAYAKNVINKVSEFMGISIQEFDINIEEFLKPQNKILPEMLKKADATETVSQSSDVQPIQLKEKDSCESKLIMCEECGRLLTPGDRFCSNCGTKIKKVCINCGKEGVEGGIFCAFCGTRF